ncbi:NADH dehydrogenase transcriptional regulator [Klebsiella variicola]|uniref:NADH dehydrogenase transcriptional regulator n=1 Tax=Klebsiella variicola TaxID=244366 RepID=A0A7H4MKM5_KLEVA|nr:NADH dehydrogenase transcriptional regulator [Klebsiella variicola]
MEKRLPGLDLDALRSFVTGMECGSFAQAALRLSRSTSAVSAQLKKLESQCGAALVAKQGAASGAHRGRRKADELRQTTAGAQ